MKMIKDGNLTNIQNGRLKLLSETIILFFLIFTINLKSENIDLAPLINLNEIQPTYDEDIFDTSKSNFNKNNNSINSDSEMNVEPYAIISLLNKITAEVKTYEIKLKQNYLFEELKIYAIDCYNSDPLEKKLSAVYFNIYNQNSSKKIFNGWMIESLPSISSLEHPIYDLWVNECYKS